MLKSNPRFPAGQFDGKIEEHGVPEYDFDSSSKILLLFRFASGIRWAGS